MEKNTGAMQSAPLVQAPPEKPFLGCFGKNRMPPVQKNRVLQPLCYEHHLEMRLTQVPLQTGSAPAQTPVYACPEPDCFVHYNSSRGYFMAADRRNGIGQGMMPEVRCLQDGNPMYLAEVRQAERSFRLWRCPRCNTSRRNNDELSQAPAA